MVNQVKMTITGQQPKNSENRIIKIIRTFIKDLIDDLTIDVDKLLSNIGKYVYKGIKREELLDYFSQYCASHGAYHSQYTLLGGRVYTKLLYEKVPKTFTEAMTVLMKNERKGDKKSRPLLNKKTYNAILKNSSLLDETIQPQNDFNLHYTSIHTLCAGYLSKVGDKIVETPQYAFMRYAMGIHKDDVKAAIETYKVINLSKGIRSDINASKGTHATPTIYNSGKRRPQMSSCFLVTMKDDSIDGIYDTLKICANVSKHCGGLGIDCNKVRANNSYIYGTNGKSNGLVGMIKVYNETAKYVNQAGKRKGAFAQSIRVWHADIEKYIGLKDNSGKDDLTAKDLFYNLWVSDLFMKRVRDGEMWSLFCPNEVRGLEDDWGKELLQLCDDYEEDDDVDDEWMSRLDQLCDQFTSNTIVESWIKNFKIFALQWKKQDISVWGPTFKHLAKTYVSKGLDDYCGKEFEKYYLSYEKQKLYRKQVSARSIWIQIYKAIVEFGGLRICFGDTINKLNNQSNVGMIRCTNLCTEIMEYTSPDEVAVCNLASIALPAYLKKYNHVTKGEHYKFDWDEYKRVIRILVRNLNKIIDESFYPIKEGKVSNMRHRPMGIGVQGLADVFQIMEIPFDCEEAMKLNRELFEVLYWTCLDEGANLAKKEGTYPSYKGSPISKGLFQFDLFQQHFKYGSNKNIPKVQFSGLVDWDVLRKKIKKYGVRNSLYVALMPTGSTAQIQWNNECFEPFHSNIFLKKLLSGEFIQINKHLVHSLEKRGLWNEEMAYLLIKHNGSVQKIEKIPKKLREVFKTAFEYSCKNVLKMGLERQPFIDQSQSFNWFRQKTTYQDFNAMMFDAWEGGMKTGLYYLRVLSQIKVINFGNEVVKDGKESMESALINLSNGDNETSDNNDNDIYTIRKNKKKPKWVCTEDECKMCGA